MNKQMILAARKRKSKICLQVCMSTGGGSLPKRGGVSQSRACNTRKGGSSVKKVPGGDPPYCCGR